MSEEVLAQHADAFLLRPACLVLPALALERPGRAATLLRLLCCGAPGGFLHDLLGVERLETNIIPEVILADLGNVSDTRKA